MQNKLAIRQALQVYSDIKKLIDVKGILFEEDFVAKLISDHLVDDPSKANPTLQDAFNIYISENPSSHRKKFRQDAERYFTSFINMFGNLTLEELKHWHITQYRDYQLSRGLNPTSVRKHQNTLNAMVNMAFRHLDINRLSPFRGLKIKGEGEIKKFMPEVTRSMIEGVKDFLTQKTHPYAYVGLIQLNTGLRLSEPLYARIEDCVLDHKIPHLWVRKNTLSDRKTKSSIRAVPLCGVSLDAAKTLYYRALKQKSLWLVPEYATEMGSNSCSAAMNKAMRPWGFRSHMFRHAFIDRIKARNDIPVRLAESITGHSSGGSEFNMYGTVGYTLEQKLEVIQKILV
jgi:integrase